MTEAGHEEKSHDRRSVFQLDARMRREAAETLEHQKSQKTSQQGKTILAGPRKSYHHMAGEAMSHDLLGVHKWKANRMFLLLVLDSHLYSFVIGIIILSNTILVIHEVDSRASGPGVPGWVRIAASIFLLIYLVELGVRFYVFRWIFFRNAWNLLDLTVVITDICAEVAAIVGFGDLPSVSVLRIFRLVRIVRVVAKLAYFQELQTMLLGFASAMKAMAWAALMIGVVLTVCSMCAVIFIHPLNKEVAETGVYRDCERCGRAFETVAESNLTFITQIIAGDSWGQITVPIIEAHPLAGVFFLAVFCIIDLGVINLVLMVIVNAAEVAREANQDMHFRKKLGEIESTKHKLKHLCRDLDTDNDGCISLEEFMEGLDRSEDLRRAMASLDVQRQDAEIIFHIMDEDKSGDVDFHEFVGTLVATKHESLTTRLLFLKACVHQIYQDLTIQGTVLEEEVVPKVDPNLIAEVVKTVQDDASSKISLQWTELMGQCQSLAEKLDQRWEQLHVEQAKTCQMLERVVGETLLQPPKGEQNQRQLEAQASASESLLPNLSAPPVAAPGKAEQQNVTRSLSLSAAPGKADPPNQPRCCTFLCNQDRPGFALRRVPLSPSGRDSDGFGNQFSQHGMVVAESVLSGSANRPSQNVLNSN